MKKKKITSQYINKILNEIKDYFKKNSDEDYMAFNNHPLSNADDLMDPKKPAPWDHLTNHPDDHDIDIEIEEEELD